MPLYVYTCPSCEIEVEELRSMSRADEPLACPICTDLCVRGVTTFSMGGRAAAPASDGGQSLVAPKRHASGCPCCAPRTISRTPPPQRM